MKWNVINLLFSVVLVAIALCFRNKLLHMALDNGIVAIDGGRYAFTMGTFSGIIIAVAIVFLAVAVRSLLQIKDRLRRSSNDNNLPSLNR